MQYATASSPAGTIHLLASAKGLAALYFDSQIGEMERRFPGERRPGAGNPWLRRAEAFLSCYFAGDLDFWPEFSFDLQGTEFQRSVWRELLNIPPGEKRTYQEVARRTGSSPRAVGAAVGMNPVSIIIPCHRVIGAGGDLTGYAGGLEVKRFLLDHEQRQAAFAWDGGGADALGAPEPSPLGSCSTNRAGAAHKVGLSVLRPS